VDLAYGVSQKILLNYRQVRGIWRGFGVRMGGFEVRSVLWHTPYMMWTLIYARRFVRVWTKEDLINADF